MVTRNLGLALLLWVTSHAVAAFAIDTAVSIPEVQRGAAAIAEVTQRRLDPPTTYRLAEGSLEKNVQQGKDNRGFRLGAHLALTYWLVRLPDDVLWRPKALARHRDVTQWTARDSGLDPAQVVRAVANEMGIPRQEEDWLLGIVHGVPHPPLGRAAPAEQARPNETQ